MPRLLAVCAVVLMGALVLPGCGDETKTSTGGASSSSQDDSAWRFVGAVEPLAVSDEPEGEASWFRRTKPGSAHVEPDDVAVELRPLYSSPVEPADSDVTVKVEGAEVVIPAGVIDRRQSLVIARAVEPAELPVQGFEAVGTWQVSLGERSVFDKPLTLRFRLPQRAAEPARRRPQPLAAMYYHPSARAWVYTPVTYDPATSHAEIRTRHLTLLTIVLRPVNNLVHDAVYTDHFAIFYSKEDILTDTEVNEGMWSDKLVTDLNKHGEPVGLARQVDAKTIEVEGRNDVPTYIVYLAKALEYAWHRYKDQGLELPEWTRTDIYVGVNSPLSDENHRGKLLGTIEITPSSTWRPSTVRVASAHEFFHTVQAEYLGLAVMSMNYRTWWLEALAEFAPRTVWGQTVPQKGMKPNFFKLPLPTVDDSHEYGCSQFVRFLVSKKGISFTELTTGTLNIPSGILAMEEISAPDFALFNKLLGVEQPFDDYTVMATCGMIDRLLRKEGTTLADAYAEFVAWAMFDDACGALVSDGDQLLSLAAGHHTIGGLALNDEKVEQVLKTEPHGTADVWALAVENPPASAKRPPRKVTVEVDGEVPPLSRLNVYVLKDNARLTGGKRPDASLSGPDPSADVAVGARDMLYIVSANNSNKPAEVKVRVLGGLDFRIEPADADDLEVREEMTFQAVSDSLPKDIPPSRLKVRWTPVFGVREESPVETVGAGFVSDYTYAWLHKGDYTLRAELLDDGKPIADASVPVKVAMTDEPSVTLEARSITVPAGKEFSISATTANAPAGSTYQWQINNNKTVKTTEPQCSFTLPSAGECKITVKMIAPEGRVVAGDTASLTVEPGEDLVWIEEHHQRDGEKILARRYQVFRGTFIKHGQWLEYYTDGKHDGALKARKTFEHSTCRKSETFYADGQPLQIAHFDEQGRYHGERSQYFSDGRRVLLENYAQGVKNGPYERLYTSGNSYTRHSGRYVDGKISGTLTLYSGNSASGREYLWKTQEHLAGKKHGKQVTYLPDGRPAGEAEYRDGKPHGWSRAWYTSEIKDGIYYLMSETLYENGKAVRKRMYNRDGEVRSDKELN
ncbi:MAG: toxin-antitoxin system YwqK family antitoxin [Phycisphaerae bacterium]